MRDLVKLYFEDRSIVNHHIASFNNFLATDDNVNSRMQKVIDEMRVPADDAEPGVIKLEVDRERYSNKEVTIRFGRKRDSDGNIVDKNPTIHIGKPAVIEVNGCRHSITPMEARLRNLNYCAPVYVDFVISKGSEGLQKQTALVGWFPIMVRSALCALNKNVMEEEVNHNLTDAEYRQRLIDSKEDPKDPGGYFIIGGTERVLITLEDLAPNRVLVERSERYGAQVEVAKVFSQKDGFRALTFVEKKDGLIMVTVPAAPTSIPIVALMKALGMEQDKDVFEAIAGNNDSMASIVYANIENSMDGTAYPPSGFHTTCDAINFLERNFASGQAKEYRVKKVESILDHSLLPHLGNTINDRMKKAIFLGRIAHSVLELALGIRKEDDKDHYANKRLRLSGDLMEDLFRTSFSSLMKDLKYQLEKSTNRKKDIIIEHAIRRDLFTNKIVHALATGNWVGGRGGVSQLLDRTSYMSTTSHLRRVASSLTRSQPHFEARDLHPTQWGRLCPSETPEGQNCGLVKNTALIIDVTEGISEEELNWHLKNEMGIRDISKKMSSPNTTRILVNGDLIGYTEDAESFVNSIREDRRSNLISDQINVRYDREMKEVIINCDDGRLRRPLIVVRDGKVTLTRKDLEDIRDSKIKWDDLFRKGIVEWIDAEEEEDAFIVVEPFTTPERCPICRVPLSTTDIEWMNPGEDGDAILKCKTCCETFAVESFVTKEHTHVEIDPMIILGVAAGLVPYPEHNSSPRVTLGAAMAKQALGVPAANYRVRPDTRGHLLHYPQIPMVQTETMKFTGYNDRPAGQNFCIAVLSYHGYNIEDALVMNKSSVQRGLGRSTFMRTYRAEERHYPNGVSDRFCIPSCDVFGARADDSYNSLDEDGFIQPEFKVNGGDVLVGKISPPRSPGEGLGFMDEKKWDETSETVKHGESGFVDSVMITEDIEGSRLVKVKVREQRVPELGDKFCSRHGQKGVIGRLVDQCDMPFTSDGITPDLIVNPHGIPSRMTVAHVLEMIGGKVGSMEARLIDGTVFSGETEESIRDELVKNGFKRTGKEIMYDGRSGKQIPTEVYTGVIFYKKLHHMVSGKLHVRSRGPVQILTRQPTEGRSRQGGLRFGEMERDCLIGHGASMVIKDRLLDESDGTIQYVCGNPKCGHIAIKDRNGSIYCPVCKKNTDIHPVQTSYAFKLLMDELLSLGVAMRLQLEDLR
ncbi:MAG: DNA-directed RNA polymerase subunit B [archaeon]|nr:DNA-directed RNA polymerase subunit B [archaeon]